MLATIIPIFRDPVPYQGTFGLLATISLENLNSIVGLLVGLATLVYLCLRIRRDGACGILRFRSLIPDRGH